MTKPMKKPKRNVQEILADLQGFDEQRKKFLEDIARDLKRIPTDLPGLKFCSDVPGVIFGAVGYCNSPPKLCGRSCEVPGGLEVELKGQDLGEALERALEYDGARSCPSMLELTWMLRELDKVLCGHP